LLGIDIGSFEVQPPSRPTAAHHIAASPDTALIEIVIAKQ